MCLTSIQLNSTVSLLNRLDCHVRFKDYHFVRHWGEFKYTVYKESHSNKLAKGSSDKVISDHLICRHVGKFNLAFELNFMYVMMMMQLWNSEFFT